MPRAKREPITTNGRPQKDIDWDEVDRRLEAGCMGTNLARLFNMHPNTFYDRVVMEKGVSFSEYLKLKRNDGDDKLRVTQFEVANKEKNTTMLIWLGKQRLDQKEHQDIVSTPNDEKLDALLTDIKAMKAKFDEKTQEAPKATTEMVKCP